MAFRIVRNDITKVKADAIVNTANPEPTYADGTDRAIYEAAGPELLLAERQRIGRLNVGQAAATPAFALPARYIIHTVGPSWQGGDQGEMQALRSCYENSLKIAEELGCESVAFPLISTGVYGFPKAEALELAVSVFSNFLLDHEMKIILVVFDSESFVLSGKIFSGIDEYIDEKTVEARSRVVYSADQGVRVDSKPSFRERKSHGRAGKAFESKLSYPSAGAPANTNLPMGSFGGDLMKESAAEYCAAVDEEEFSAPGDSLEQRMKHLDDTWQEALLWWIDEKGYTDVEVYKRANVDRKLFSKIRNKEEYQPKKMTAVAFALALRLNLDETQDLLKRAGFVLSHSNKFDIIIEYFIQQGIYDTYTINLALFDHRQPLLGE